MVAHLNIPVLPHRNIQTHQAKITSFIIGNLLKIKNITKGK